MYIVPLCIIYIYIYDLVTQCCFPQVVIFRVATYVWIKSKVFEIGL